MRVIENTPERLVLKGTPGSAIWMLFAALLGIAIMTATTVFAWHLFHDGQYLALIPITIGFLLGTAFAILGSATLAVGRMKLTLDRPTGTGNYEVYSPIVEAGKPFSFRLDNIESVRVANVDAARNQKSDVGVDTARVCSAELRIRRPRRAIVLDSTENGREKRVRSLADAVASWLDAEVSTTAG